MKMMLVLIIGASLITGVAGGLLFSSANNKPVIQTRTIEVPVYRYITSEPIVRTETIETTVYRYPQTPPYQTLPDPIDREQAILLLSGMRQSHIAALNWQFTSDPGFGIADKEFQNFLIHEYDQLLEFVGRTN